MNKQLNEIYILDFSALDLIDDEEVLKLYMSEYSVSFLSKIIY